MFFHLTLFLWSITYLLSLEFLALNPRLTEWSGYGSSILFISVITLLAVYRTTQKMTGVPIPLLFSLATPTLLFLIDNPSNQHVFVFISSMAFYSLLLGLYRLRFAPTDETARAFMHAGGVAALFLFYAACYGLYLNFNIDLWMLMTVFFVATFGVAFQMFRVVGGREKKEVILLSAFLALVMAEAAWIASMLPFGYLTTAALLTIIFFSPWEALLLSLTGRFIERQVFLRALSLIGLSAILLLSSPWRMLV